VRLFLAVLVLAFEVSGVELTDGAGDDMAIMSELRDGVSPSMESSSMASSLSSVLASFAGLMGDLK